MLITDTAVANRARMRKAYPIGQMKQKPPNLDANFWRMRLAKISSTLRFFKGHSTLNMQGKGLHRQMPQPPWMSGFSCHRIWLTFSTSSARLHRRSRSNLSFLHNPFGYSRSPTFLLEQLKVAGTPPEPRRDVNPKLLISITLLDIRHIQAFQVSFTFITVWSSNSVEIIWSICGCFYTLICDWMWCILIGLSFEISNSGLVWT